MGWQEAAISHAHHCQRHLNSNYVGSQGHIVLSLATSMLLARQRNWTQTGPSFFLGTCLFQSKRTRPAHLPPRTVNSAKSSPPCLPWCSSSARFPPHLCASPGAGRAGSHAPACCHGTAAASGRAGSAASQRSS
eukprot:385443-Pelagomonas_calceolata.AAC.12